MDRLNYFNPYQSKDGHHEDQLTRAYLVLLKHSGHAFFTFFEYCRSNQKVIGDEKSISIVEYMELGWEIETQKGNPEINTNYLLSVLITDSHLAAGDSKIHPSERNARYDGIITFGNNLAMVIENKPRSANVWFGQLNPSRQNLAENTIIYSMPLQLEWKEVIKQLNHLLSMPTLAGYEKFMIEDFLSFIDEKFPYLNPYDTFPQCKGNAELLSRRISNLLKSITLNEANVKLHKNWGYYIQCPYEQIQEIGLILKQNDKEKSWWLELSLFFGDTQRQAIYFYKSNPTFIHLQDKKWFLYANFHVSFMTSNLVWFQSDDNVIYLKYWNHNVKEIYQRKRQEVSDYIQDLVDKKIINLSEDVKDKLEKYYYSTAMKSLNICPGFGIIYKFSSADAEKYDKEGKLKFLIAEKIREGLKVIGVEGNDLLKKF